MSCAFVALGANLGDPVRTLQSAFQSLTEQPGVLLLRTSSLYRTAPVGLTGQPDFINAVAAVDTALSAAELLEALLAIETAYGRRRAEKNGPRTLDLDLLLYGDQIINQARLTLPHPRLHLRAFVLAPLCEIAPDLAIPGRGLAKAWLPAVASQTIQRL